MCKVAGLVGVKELKLFSFKRVVGKPTECFFLADFEIEAHSFFYYSPRHVHCIKDAQTNKRYNIYRAKSQYTKREHR